MKMSVRRSDIRVSLWSGRSCWRVGLWEGVAGGANGRWVSVVRAVRPRLAAFPAPLYITVL